MSWRARLSKSASSPVRKRHEWKTGRSTAPPGCQAGSSFASSSVVTSWPRPASRPTLKAGHHCGDVPAIGREMARAHQPRDREARVGAVRQRLLDASCRRAGSPAHGPTGRNQRGLEAPSPPRSTRSGPARARPRALCSRPGPHASRTTSTIHGRSRSPTAAAGVNSHGRSGPVELDLREIVGLDTDRAVDRVGADHLLALNKPMMSPGPRTTTRCSTGWAHTRDRDADRRGRQRRLRAAERVGLGDRRREAAAHEGQEMIARLGHQWTLSCAPTTRTGVCPASAPLAA